MPCRIILSLKKCQFPYFCITFLLLFCPNETSLNSRKQKKSWCTFLTWKHGCLVGRIVGKLDLCWSRAEFNLFFPQPVTHLKSTAAATTTTTAAAATTTALASQQKPSSPLNPTQVLLQKQRLSQSTRADHNQAPLILSHQNFGVVFSLVFGADDPSWSNKSTKRLLFCCSDEKEENQICGSFVFVTKHRRKFIVFPNAGHQTTIAKPRRGVSSLKWSEVEMGGCCSKFGTYFVKKEEAKSGHDGSPKLNKLEHKTSFMAEKVRASFFPPAVIFPS